MSWLHWSLLSALFAGLTAILAKIGVRDVDSNLATAVRTVVIGIMAWGIAWARGATDLGSVGGRTWLFLGLSGVATGASWLCYFQALKQGEASRVAPVDKLSVVVAMLLAWMALGEPMSWRKWVGGGLILAGSLLVAKG